MILLILILFTGLLLLANVLFVMLILGTVLFELVEELVVMLLVVKFVLVVIFELFVFMVMLVLLVLLALLVEFERFVVFDGIFVVLFYSTKKTEGGFKVNKSELISKVADLAKFTKSDAARAVDAFIEAVKKSLASGEEVRLVGFGTYTVVKREATEGRNPRTGAVIKIPASKQPKFRAGKELKEAVNTLAKAKKAA